MLRGLVGVVPPQSLEVGRFYVAPTYTGGHMIFQWIRTNEQFEGSSREMALIFSRDGRPCLETSFPDHTAMVALDDVHIRVDPTSVRDENQLRRDMFILAGDGPIVCAPSGFREWFPVDLSTGRPVQRPQPSTWLRFTRWSLVVDDEAGDELTITQFGVEEEESRCG